MKLSLIDRSVITFESYIDSDVGSRFYSEKFIEGIYARKNELNVRTAKMARSLILVTLLLAFFHSIGSPITISGITLNLSDEIASVLCVIVSFGVVGMIYSFIDQIILNRYFAAIGKKVHIFSFDLFNLDKSAIDLWSDPVTPRYFGPRSRTSHKATLNILLIFSIFISATFVLFPSIVSVIHIVKCPTEN